MSLSSIDCVSASRCYAVGSAGALPIIDTLDGAAWTQTAVSAGPSVAPVRLYSISCPKFSSCTSVGLTKPTHVLERPIAVTLAAGRWTVANLPFLRAPDPYGDSPQLNYLSAVSCSAPIACEAGGAAATNFNSLGAFYTTP
jgi:hypothetical protein